MKVLRALKTEDGVVCEKYKERETERMRRRETEGVRRPGRKFEERKGAEEKGEWEER